MPDWKRTRRKAETGESYEAGWKNAWRQRTHVSQGRYCEVFLIGVDVLTHDLKKNVGNLPP